MNSDYVRHLAGGESPNLGNLYTARRPVVGDPRVAHEVTDPEGICSLLHVPIQVDGEVFGVFGVNYCHDHTFSGAEERLLMALAGRAAVAIANAREHQQALYTATVDEDRKSNV